MSQASHSAEARLHAKVVDVIFEKLTLVYGHRFLGNWEGLPIARVKADWAHELARFHDSPEAIAFGLQNLPAAYPPNVFEFRAICNRRPDPNQMELLQGPKKAAPDFARSLADELQRPRDKDEPERVRWARRYIELWGSPGQCLTFQQRVHLADARRIVERNDNPLNSEEELRKLKAEIQARVDARLGEGAKP